MSNKNILVEEYEQAGAACRNHDSLIRTGITIFGAAQAAILGILMNESKDNFYYTFSLELLGFWLSIVVYVTTFRLGQRYATYMERVKDLEWLLGFKLYTSSQEKFDRTWYLKYMPGNKTSLATLPILTAIMYGCFLLNHLFKFWE